MMSSRSMLGGLAALAVVLLASPCCRAHDIPAEMRVAAERFLKTLPADAAAQVKIPFDAEKRTAWHYVPSVSLESQGGRRGLPIKKMTAQQRVFAMALLNSALSHRGQLQAATIMALETVLKQLEGGMPPATVKCTTSLFMALLPPITPGAGASKDITFRST